MVCFTTKNQSRLQRNHFTKNLSFLVHYPNIWNSMQLSIRSVQVGNPYYSPSEISSYHAPTSVKIVFIKLFELKLRQEMAENEFHALLEVQYLFSEFDNPLQFELFAESSISAIVGIALFIIGKTFTRVLLHYFIFTLI